MWHMGETSNACLFCPQLPFLRTLMVVIPLSQICPFIFSLYCSKKSTLHWMSLRVVDSTHICFTLGRYYTKNHIHIIIYKIPIFNKMLYEKCTSVLLKTFNWVTIYKWKSFLYVVQQTGASSLSRKFG